MLKADSGMDFYDFAAFLATMVQQQLAAMTARVLDPMSVSTYKLLPEERGGAT